MQLVHPDTVFRIVKFKQPNSTGRKISGPKPVKREYTSPVRKIMNSLIGVDYLYLGGAVIQVISGLLMVLIGILMLVTPIWLAFIISSIGCLATMTGFFQIYDLIKNTDATKKITNEAVHRALKSQN